MKFRSIRLLAIVGAALVLGACQGVEKGYVHAGNLDASIAEVSARHDAYVRADASISNTEKESYLTSTALLGRIMDEAMGRPPRPIEPFVPAR